MTRQLSGRIYVTELFDSRCFSGVWASTCGRRATSGASQPPSPPLPRGSHGLQGLARAADSPIDGCS